MVRTFYVCAVVLIAMFAARVADAQCWNCFVTQPFIVGPPVIIMQQPPMIVQQPPIIVQQPPMIVQQPPMIVQQPPMIVQQPPMVVQQTPQPIAPQVIIESPRGQTCWKQYAGSDNWGQPMYINACN